MEQSAKPGGSARMRRRVSLGIIAWNEEAAIGAMLESLFAQSLFAELGRRGQSCEILCVLNGCTDRTPDIAGAAFARLRVSHPHRGAIHAAVVSLAERGKINAWNQFTHALSAPEAEYIFYLDSDIILRDPDTLWSMLETLERNPDAWISTDQPIKDIIFKSQRSLAERLSLAATSMTQSASAQLTGQLYCARSIVARNLYLPRDLAACEDGFIKSVVCTDFLAGPPRPDRIAQAPRASHVFEAYTSVKDIMNNQKRQMIGQTIVHLLVDQELRRLSRIEREHLAQTLKAREAEDPAWLRRLIALHLSQTRRFWRLFPGILTFRFRRLAALPPQRRLAALPAALAGWTIMLVACWRAHRFLRRGAVDYWPDTQSPKLRDLQPAPF